MANIALVVQELSTTSSTKTLALLREYKEHSTSLLPQTALYSELILYDIIILVRFTPDDSLISQLKKVAEKGIPIIIGYERTSSTSLLMSLGFTTVSPTTSADVFPNVTIVKQALVDTFGIGTAGDVLTHWNSTDYICTVSINNTPSYIKVFTTCDIRPSEVSISYLPPTTVNNKGASYLSRILFMNTLYGQNVAYTSTFSPFFKSVLEFMLKKNYYISGKTLSVDKVPSSNKLFAYDQETGKLLVQSQSDAEGNFNISVPIGTKVFVVCAPNGTTNNAQIRYNVTPELIVNNT